MSLLFSYIWSLWCYSILIVIFIISVPIGLFLSWASSDFFCFFTFYLAKVIFFLIGVRVIVKGNFPIKSKEPVIYIANHSSYLDPVFTSFLVKKKHKYLGKEEVLSWPIFGSVVKKHMVAVKRELKESRSTSMNLMRDTILQDYSIILYPEGGWKDDAEQEHPYDIKQNTILNKFRNGAFRLAIDTKTKIIPISICKANKIHCSETMRFVPGKVIIYISNAIQTNNLSMKEKDIINLNEKSYSIIYNNLMKHEINLENKTL